MRDDDFFEQFEREINKMLNGFFGGDREKKSRHNVEYRVFRNGQEINNQESDQIQSLPDNKAKKEDFSASEGLAGSSKKYNHDNIGVDICNSEKEIILTMELPGLKKEDLEVGITNEGVEVKVKPRKQQNKDMFYSRYEEFQKTIPLPMNVNGNKAKATLKNGIFEIKMPKSKTQNQKKVIIA